MKRIKICLNSFDKIKDFINITYCLDCKLNLISGSYVADGKSILGIFNLDLSKPIEVNIIGEKPEPDFFPKELAVFMI
jgi:hypothetical protein